MFAGEVVIAAAIVLATPRLVRDAPRRGPRAGARLGRLACCSALGLGLLVFGVLQREHVGLARAAQLAGRAVRLLARRRSSSPPAASCCWRLPRAGSAARGRSGERARWCTSRCSTSPSLRSGLVSFLGQNLVLMGVFFAIPLYLQVVQGFDALQTGVRMLPTSVALFVTALVGARLATRFSPRTIVRAGFVFLLAAVGFLLGTIEPQIDTPTSPSRWRVLGVGMGLVVSQLGNVVQSAVGESDRSEAGGLQYTAQQLGSSLGTALIGAIVITGLAAAFTAQRRRRPAHLAGDAGPGLACGWRATCRSSTPTSVEQAAQAAGLAGRDGRARRGLLRRAARGAEARPARLRLHRARLAARDARPAARGGSGAGGALRQRAPPRGGRPGSPGRVRVTASGGSCALEHAGLYSGGCLRDTC